VGVREEGGGQGRVGALVCMASDERTNHAAFFVGRCHGDIFIKNGSFSIQRGLKVRHSTKISTKFVKQVKSYSLLKYTTYTAL
jgi:hypothetical protein